MSRATYDNVSRATYDDVSRATYDDASRDSENQYNFPEDEAGVASRWLASVCDVLVFAL